MPDAGSTWFLVRQVGYSRAFELAVEAERIPAGRCLELGLVNRVVEPAVLLTEAQAWAEKLAQRPTYTVGLTKRALNKAFTNTLLQSVEYEAHLQQLASESEDFAEGVQAFKEKRGACLEGKISLTRIFSIIRGRGRSCAYPGGDHKGASLPIEIIP